MENKYPHIFSPLKVGNVTFKNRIFTAPATPHLLQTDEEYPTDPYIAYYVEKARGGAACVCVGGHNMNPYAPPMPGHHNINVRNPIYQKYWNKLTDQIHFYGAKASIEFLAFFYHGFDSQGKLVNYSTDGRPGPDGSPRPALTRDAMERIAEDYGVAAEGAVKCGFDSILIHGGHGLPIFRMLSPLFSDRNDEFGGSLENRARFAIMILDKIREKVGRKILIEYRISGDELAPEGGFKVEDCVEFLRLVGDRIDIAHISAGNMSIPGTEAIMHPTIFCKPAQNAYLAKAVKEAGVPQPVLTLGAFQDPELIEKTLAEGGADIVAMARGLIADPQMPNKAFDRKEEEIIPCIKCFHCLDYNRAPTYACSVNPTVGREDQLSYLIPPVGEKKKVVIVGGGPSGMEAAITAARRGHDVTIYERANRLGGKLVFSEKVSFKYDLKKFMDYQINLVNKLGVTVKLNTEATPELIAAENADVVLAAVGANAIVPPIPGADGKNVLIAEESYEKAGQLGQKIVLIGGGEVGCETALYLAGIGKDVTVVEMLDKLAAETLYLPREPLVENLEKAATCYTNARCTGITDKGITIVDKDGKERFIEADAVVLSAGMRPRSNEAEAFRAVAPRFSAIGDCVIAKNVRTATRYAFDAASQI